MYNEHTECYCCSSNDMPLETAQSMIKHIKRKHENGTVLVDDFQMSINKRCESLRSTKCS